MSCHSSYGDYASRTDAGDREEAIGLLRSGDSITWREHLSNEEVLGLMERSHVAALPTLDDTLGWSVLEAMSVGLPVVGSNIYAMCENVLDGESGFTIPLAQDELGRWRGLGMRGDALRKERETAYEALAGELYARFSQLIEDEGLVRNLGRGAVEHVRRRYDPATQGARLRAVYGEALGEDVTSG